MAEKFRLEEQMVQRMRTPLVWSAVVGWIGCFIGYVIDAKQFHFSYLVSIIYFLSICLGALFFVMIQYVCTAGWSVVVRRIAETVMRNIDVCAVLFIPVLIGIPHLYHWVHPEPNDIILQKKAGYLNIKFFVARAVVYFGIWVLISRAIYKHSIAQDEDGKAEHNRRSMKWSAPGILLLFLSGSLAAFDWLMSLDPHWYSTIFGVYFFSGSAVAFVALLILFSMYLRKRGVLSKEITHEHYHDLGKLLFAFTVFWAYIAFSQYFLIWYANLPEETGWYLHRQEGSWLWVSLLIVFGHFLFPFLALISRIAKRNLKFLSFMAMWMMVMHYVDIYWIVMPTLSHHGVHVHWLDVAALLAVMGTLGVVFVSRLGKNAIVPIKDPFLSESLHFENV
ncbi:MAG: hypothetical protein RMM17_10060 [Acidobacteriota bacterium]|nr:hypothetical protein [Blastocatellia bacterium]MDW8413013.1 hypothetical protein [Acidobacteriota bacterium]